MADGVTDRAALRARVVRGFEGAFGAAPARAAWAPGRVNLIGEHTDYNAGYALPIAIDRGCVAVARAGAGDRDRLVAADVGERVGFGDGDRDSGWGAYVRGVLALMRERLGGPERVDLAFGSTVPMGAGLSSSASLEVSIATVWEAIVGAELTVLEKARLCRRAEHEFAGVPCGLMDQLVACGARAGNAMLIDFADETWQEVAGPPAGSVLVVDSGVRHELAAGEYAKRRRACEAAARVLGVASLREATREIVDDARLDQEQRRRVRHVVSENERTHLAATALKRGELEELGKLMFESHRSLRDDYQVSCAEVDAIVDAAVATGGVYGARMTGGGFGGCAIVLGHAGTIARMAERAIAGERGKFIVSAGGGARLL
jgi:galactokinase